MSIVNRLVRLFKADIHGLIDCLEEPEMVLKQAIRDMEEEVRNGEDRINALINRSGQLTERQDELRGRIKELEKQLEICFAEKNEQLGKSIVRRKLELVRAIAMVTRTSQELQKEIHSRRERLSVQQERLASVIDKLKLFGATKATEPNVNDYLASSRCCEAIAITEEEVELAYLAEKRNRAEEEPRTAA